jgi:hypothetical protein
MTRIVALCICIFTLIITSCSTGNQATITGELKQWHAVTLSFTGPQTIETDAVNPFTDYRLTVTFTGPTGRIAVPGYYAADGNAGETSAESGGIWRAHFAPPATGEYTYTTSFRTGAWIVVDNAPDAGKPTAFDGASGRFTVGPTDKSGRDFRAHGTLVNPGGHYPQFAGSGEYFLKGGADSPENFLAYIDFDGTHDVPKKVTKETESKAPDFLHKYEPHAGDWKPGNPTWQSGKGKNIIGALNYLASTGMNSVYFLTMNVTGDGNDIWPWISHEDYTRFDCSKLDQWNIVFSHMQSKGLMLHVITQETENDQLINGGDLGAERKLYYRELIARFAHHNAMVWMLGEENTNTTAQIKAFAKYIKNVDPWDHPITIHTYPNLEKKEGVYAPLLGYDQLDGLSMQNKPSTSHAEIIDWMDRADATGKPWIIYQDEQNPASTGVMPDADDPGHDEIRDKFLWGSLLAGSAGVEWYMGYKYAQNDLVCEDWRARANMWQQTKIALDFMHKHLPFTAMRHADALTAADNDYVFAKAGEVYAVYLPQGGATTLDLGNASGTFSVQWFNPRLGGALYTGSVTQITGPGSQALGNPPADAGEDWVVLVKRI